MEVVVSPKRRAVHLGQDASFSCYAPEARTTVQYHWQLPSALVDSGRPEYDENTLTIVDTQAADNNTDVTCIVLRQGKLLGSGKGELVVLPALPDVETTASTAPSEPTTAEVGSTAKRVPTEAEKLMSTLSTTAQDASTLAMTSSPVSSTSVEHSTITTETSPTSMRATTSAGTSTPYPSKMANGSQQGPTQSSVDGLRVGVVAPAVVGGLVLLVCILVTAFFLTRRRRRKSARADAEMGRAASKSAEVHMYEFIAPPGSLDFKDGGGSDEENHNKKRRGNNYVNRDSLRTYSRGTAPDSIARYAQAVSRKDRIVSAGGHGGKSRRAPVLTLSMNSLYEDTTPTFVVATANNPKNGYVDVLPVIRPTGKTVEIVGREEPPSGSIEDEDQYVTLAHVPSMQEDCNEQDSLF